MIRLARRFWLLAVLSIAAFISRAAFAASHDADASKLREAAIYTDYLATDFASAEKKLTQALALCDKPADCTPATRARLHCDLGAVYFASQKAADGRTQFAAAVKEDPNVDLDPDLTTPDLQKELAAAKAGGGKATTAPPAAGAGANATDNGDETETEEDDGGAPAAPAPKAAPKATTNDSDCPPGFPGCKSSESSTTCSNDDDCGPGEKCVGEVCKGTKEEENNGPAKRNWISLSYQLDLLLLPAKNNVCSGGQGYSCFNSNGTWYSGTPAEGYGGQIPHAGIAPGTMRVLLGYDRLVLDNLMIGAAAGFAFNGGPTRKGGSAFLPLHVEARLKYWFGHNPMARKGFRFYIMAEGGLMEAAASVSQVNVYEQPAPPAIREVAWYHIGRGFGGAGLGTMWAFTPNMGIHLELRGAELFPTLGTAFGAQLGYAIGL